MKRNMIRGIPGLLPLWGSKPAESLWALAHGAHLWLDRSFGARVRGFRHRGTLSLMITGTNGKTTTTTMVARIMMRAGYKVGYCTTDGITIDGRVVRVGDYAGFIGARTILEHRPRVDCAVLETARGGLRRRGLYLARCNVAALLNIGLDHIGQDGIDSFEAMLSHKKQVTDAAYWRVVLNAEDCLVRELAKEYGAQRSTLFALNEAAVADHASAGGEAVTVANGDVPWVVHRAQGKDTKIIPVEEIPKVAGGRVRFIVANVLAATAIALSLGVQSNAIADSLRHMELGDSLVSGRFQSIEGFPFLVYVDRGTNPAALSAFFEAISDIRPKRGVTRAMLTAPGNRPDGYYEEMAKIARRSDVDDFVLFDSEVLRRNREPGEIPERMANWLYSDGVPKEKVTKTPDVRKAVRELVSHAKPGDILCFFGENLDQDLSRIVLEELHKSHINSI